MMEKLNNVPRLRFPEFQEEWVVKKIDEIAEKVNSGKTPLGGDSVYSETGILFIRSQNVADNRLSYENSTFIPDEINDTMKNSIVKPRDILLNITGASLGRSCVVPDDFTVGNVNQHVCIVRLNKSSDPYFLQPIFSSEKGQNLFNSLQTGSGREGLNFHSIRQISLPFPTLPEQQKIASFLTAVDEKLQALKKKKSLLEQYKKGVMQKIFSQELRFRDDNGEAFPDWGKVKFGEIYTFKVTNSLSRDKLNYTEGEVRNIHYGDIHTKFNILFDIKKEPVPFVNDNVLLNILSEDSYCKEGDLVIADASEDYNDIGKSIEILNLDGEKVLAGLHTFLARPNRNTMSPGFGGYLMRSEKVKLQLMFIAQGTKVLSISTSRLSNIEIDLPIIFEQKKIVDFLSNLDSKIACCTNEIQLLEIWKKGLLQRLFV